MTEKAQQTTNEIENLTQYIYISKKDFPKVFACMTMDKMREYVIKVCRREGWPLDAEHATIPLTQLEMEL